MSRPITISLILLVFSCIGFGQPASKGTRMPPRNRMMLERLNRLPGPDRDRVLKNLPPERKAHIEERLGRYNALPEGQREKLKQEYDQFQKLSPEKQRRVRQLYRTLNEMPRDRRGPVTSEYASLRNMSPEERKERLAGSSFKARFNSTEQELLENLTESMSASQVAASPDK